MSLFNGTQSVFEQQLKEIFKPVENTTQSSLFSVLSLVLYYNPKLTELHDVYDLIGLDNFIKLISLLDGRQVRFPTSNELKDAIVFSLCFFYKEIEQKDWDEIHTLVPYNFNSISMAYKIKSLNSSLANELKNILSDKKGGKK
ncbi:MAG: hypothetical protein ACRCZB_05200 [Bacteroidales bacterium]